MALPFEPMPYVEGYDPLETALKTQGMPSQVVQDTIPFMTDEEALNLNNPILQEIKPPSDSWENDNFTQVISKAQDPAGIAWQNEQFGKLPQEHRVVPTYNLTDVGDEATGLNALEWTKENFLSDPDYIGFNNENNPVFQEAMQPFLDKTGADNLNVANWCAAFLNGILNTADPDFMTKLIPANDAGIIEFPTKSDAKVASRRATEFSRIGELIYDSKTDKGEVTKDNPYGINFKNLQKGDIIIFSNNKRLEDETRSFEKGRGHVALVDDIDQVTGRIHYVGGNQQTSSGLSEEINRSVFNAKSSNRTFRVVRLNRKKIKDIIK